MAVEVTIICDRCARIIDAAKTATKAREENRRQGGRSRPPVDLCRDCVEAQARAKEGQQG